MDYGLNEVKDLRKKFGLTQGELAKKSGVSQSLIAKIEAGRIDPTYSKTQKIFEAIETLNEKDEVNAGQIMNKKIVMIEPSDSVRSAIKKMRKYEFSQMPVMQGGKAVGVISEGTILAKIAELDDPEKIGKLKVDDVMDDCPPILPKDAKVKAISSLLRYYPTVLIADSGKLVGLVTKSDVLSTLYTQGK